MAYSYYDIIPGTPTSNSVSIEVRAPIDCDIGLYWYSYSRDTWTLAWTKSSSDYNRNKTLYTYDFSCGGFTSGTSTKFKAICYDGPYTNEVTSGKVTFGSGTSYTLTYDGNEATSGSVPSSSSGTNITLSSNTGNLAKTGYSFNGWTVNGQNYSVGSTVRISQNTTAYAWWIPVPVTTTFRDYYTGWSEAVSETYGATYIMPSGRPTRAGYTQTGGGNEWWTEWDRSTTKITSTSTVPFAYDHALYAHWEGNTITVTFDYGTGSNTKSETYGSTYVLPTQPYRTGYTFQGWWTQASGGTQITTSTTVSTSSNHTVYAHWSVDTCTVTLNVDGSTYMTRTVNYGSPISDWPTPTKTGYTFAGWYTSSSGGVLVNTNSAITSSFTAYAHWTANNYKLNITVGVGIEAVFYKINGNSTYSNTTSNLNIDVTYGTTIYCYGVAKSYYIAPTYTSTNVWSQAVSTSGNTFNISTTLKTYTLKYNGNGNTGGTVPSNKTWQYGQQGLVVGTSDLSKTGYTRNGWNTRADGGGTQYGDTAVITFDNNASDLTLYSKWVANTYSLSFNVNGGSGSVNGVNVTYDGKYSNLPAGPSRTGYTFAGWFTEASGGTQIKSTDTVKITSNTTLYAHWTANTYYIKYNGNGNTGGSMANSTHTYDVNKNLTANGFTKTGYYFSGWATSPTGAIVYTNSQSVKNLTSTNGGTYNLYAVWEMNKTVSVKTNNSWRNLNLTNSVYVNVNGTWKSVNIENNIWINVNGTWKTININ